MADTWVITRHPRKTGILGWLSLLLIGGVVGWIGYGYWQSFQSAFTPDIGVETNMKWINADGKKVWQFISTAPLNATVMIKGDIFVTRCSDEEAKAGNDSQMEREPTIETTCVSLTDGSIRWQAAGSAQSSFAP